MPWTLASPHTGSARGPSTSARRRSRAPVPPLARHPGRCFCARRTPGAASAAGSPSRSAARTRPLRPARFHRSWPGPIETVEKSSQADPRAFLPEEPQLPCSTTQCLPMITLDQRRGRSSFERSVEPFSPVFITCGRLRDLPMSSSPLSSRALGKPSDLGGRLHPGRGEPRAPAVARRPWFSGKGAPFGAPFQARVGTSLAKVT